MRFLLFLALFIFTSSYAREYVDPNSRVRKGLLEEEHEGIPSSSNNSNNEIAVKTVDMSGESIYCNCLGLKKLYEKKKNLLHNLVSDRVVDDSNWRLRDAAAKDVDMANVAVKKAIYQYTIDLTEISCPDVKTNFRKISEMESSIDLYRKNCTFVKE